MPARLSILLLAALAFADTSAAQSLRPTLGDFVIKNFRFASGEVLSALRLHYRTLGKRVRDAKGQVRNAVLIMHGTGGTGEQFEAPSFAAEYSYTVPNGAGLGNFRICALRHTCTECPG